MAAEPLTRPGTVRAPHRPLPVASVALAIGAPTSLAGLGAAATLVRSGPARAGTPIDERKRELETV